MRTERLLEEQERSGTRFWSEDEEMHAHNKPRSEHSCRSCHLVKWYPPLLTMSTIMAGVFCWLYVTKPVVVTKTMVPKLESQPSLLVSKELGAGHDLVVKVEDEKLVGETLNPELGFLPGEEPSSEPVFSNIIPGQDAQVVRVKRSERPLFQPLKEEELPAPEISEEMEELVAGEEVGGSNVPIQLSTEDAELQDEGGEFTGETFPVDASSQWESKADGPIREVAISLMGEIVSSDKIETKIIASSLDDLDLE